MKKSTYKTKRRDGELPNQSQPAGSKLARKAAEGSVGGPRGGVVTKALEMIQRSKRAA